MQPLQKHAVSSLCPSHGGKTRFKCVRRPTGDLRRVRLRLLTPGWQEFNLAWRDANGPHRSLTAHHWKAVSWSGARYLYQAVAKLQILKVEMRWTTYCYRTILSAAECIYVVRKSCKGVCETAWLRN